MRLRRDPESGLILPRERRIEAPESRLCSMLPVFQQGQFGRSIGAGADSTALAIYNDLVAWWEFEQNNTDTFWDDAHSTHDMTISLSGTTATYGTGGKIGSRAAGNMTSSSRNGAPYVPRSNTTFDKGDVSFSFGAWIRPSFLTIAANSYVTFIGRLAWAVGGAHYGIHYVNAGGGKTGAVARWGDNTNSTFVEVSTGNFSGTWRHFVFRHDASANTLSIFVDGVATSSAYSNGVYSGGDGNFALNNIRNDSTLANSAVGATYAVDNLFFLDHAITQTEVDYIYNGGTGRTYAALKAAAGF